MSEGGVLQVLRRKKDATANDTQEEWALVAALARVAEGLEDNKSALEYNSTQLNAVLLKLLDQDAEKVRLGSMSGPKAFIEANDCLKQLTELSDLDPVKVANSVPKEQAELVLEAYRAGSKWLTRFVSALNDIQRSNPSLLKESE